MVDGPNLRSTHDSESRQRLRFHPQSEPESTDGAREAPTGSEQDPLTDRVVHLARKANLDRLDDFTQRFHQLCRCYALDGEAQLLALLGFLGTAASAKALLGTVFFGGRPVELLEFVNARQDQLRAGTQKL